MTRPAAAGHDRRIVPSAFGRPWATSAYCFVLAAVVPVAEAVEGRPSGASGGIVSSIAWGAAMWSLSIALLAFAETVRMSATESRARQSGWRAALIGALLLGGSANGLLGLVVLGQHHDGWQTSPTDRRVPPSPALRSQSPLGRTRSANGSLQRTAR